jgi:hypothetical protein
MSDNFEWDPRVPADKQFSWYNVTTWADRDWWAAVDAYYRETAEARGDRKKMDAANARVTYARADYRGRVLSWYFKLCTPIVPGECTPNMVAELLAEAWDLGEMRWWS